MAAFLYVKHLTQSISGHSQHIQLFAVGGFLKLSKNYMCQKGRAIYSEYCSNGGPHTTKASSAQVRWIRKDLGVLMECVVTRVEDKSN